MTDKFDIQFFGGGGSPYMRDAMLRPGDRYYAPSSMPRQQDILRLADEAVNGGGMGQPGQPGQPAQPGSTGYDRIARQGK